jgi:hypothetical protein
MKERNCFTTKLVRVDKGKKLLQLPLISAIVLLEVSALPARFMTGKAF